MKKKSSSHRSGPREHAAQRKQPALHLGKEKLGHRPTDYRPEYAELAYKACLMGAIDRELADLFCVSISTINLWKKKHPTFSESITRAKKMADLDVVYALFQRAMGSRWIQQQAVKLKRYGDVDGKWVCIEEYVEVVNVERAVPGCVRAIIFWLKNRCPEHWKDKVFLEESRPGLIEMFKFAKDRMRQERLDALLNVIGGDSKK